MTQHREETQPGRSDRTTATTERHPDSQEMIVSMKMDLPTDPALVSLLRQGAENFLQHMGISDDDIYRAGIVLSEACANVILHAYNDSTQRYLVETQLYRDKLRLIVTDFGRGFDADRVPEPELGQIGGYGVYFIRQASDRVDFDCPGGVGSRMRAEIRLHYGYPEARRHASARNWR